MVQTNHTFLFADLCNYTEHTWNRGDTWSAEAAVGFHTLVRGLATEECCEVIKTVGDAVMVRAGDPTDAVRLAHRIHAASADPGQLPVRIGIDTGPAVPVDGDWYGTTVNTAARVAEAATPGELLLTERANNAVYEDDVETFGYGPRALKGLPDCVLYGVLDAVAGQPV
jgi:adenylate cyclase